MSLGQNSAFSLTDVSIFEIDEGSTDKFLTIFFSGGERRNQFYPFLKFSGCQQKETPPDLQRPFVQKVSIAKLNNFVIAAHDY